MDIKLLEENMGEDLWYLGISKISQIQQEKTLSKRKKMNRLNYIKIKTFCFLRDTKRVKRQPLTGTKYLEMYISDKRIAFKVYRELSELSK